MNDCRKPPAQLAPQQRRPLCVQFVVTSMPVGGAETLLVNLVRRLDRRRFEPEVICLKEPGELGEDLSSEITVYSRLLRHKYDARVFWKLWRIMRRRQAAAVITVAAGDNMFWGRLAAFFARTPVVASALHSTGWPDGVSRLNRMLTPITDAFIAVADEHGRFLVEEAGFPIAKVHTIYNGVDTDRFAPRGADEVRRAVGLAEEDPVVAILAALRPEKNHELFLQGAALIVQQAPDAKFLIIGDGPRRAALEALCTKLKLDDAVQFLGNRADIPELLAAVDVLALTSHNEASPVSILEGLCSGCPVVASDVGSVRETVVDGETGLIVPAGDVDAYAAAVTRLLSDADYRARLGAAGRRLVIDRWSLDGMTRGYEQLIERLYDRAARRRTPVQQSSLRRQVSPDR